MPENKLTPEEQAEYERMLAEEEAAEVQHVDEPHVLSGWQDPESNPVQDVKDVADAIERQAQHPAPSTFQGVKDSPFPNPMPAADKPADVEPDGTTPVYPGREGAFRRTSMLDVVKRAMGEGNWMTKEEIAKDVERITGQVRKVESLMGAIRHMKADGDLKLDRRTFQRPGATKAVTEYRYVRPNETQPGEVAQ